MLAEWKGVAQVRRCATASRISRRTMALSNRPWAARLAQRRSSSPCSQEFLMVGVSSPILEPRS
jgi:hypothetical protein